MPNRFWLRFVIDTTTQGGSDDPTPPTSEQPPQPAPTEAPTTPEPKTFDADYVDKLRREAAKYRTDAKANAAAAARLAEIEEANKTAEQKQAEALANLQAENARLQADMVRARVAAAKGVPADLLAGTTEDELNAAADRLLAFKGETPPADFGAGQRGQKLDPLQDMQRAYDEAVKTGNTGVAVAMKRRMSELQQTKQ